MPYKEAQPEIRANALQTTSSSAAYKFYDTQQAVNYTTSSNTNIQKDLTLHALLLATQSQHSTCSREDISIVLDIGAGSGFSTQATEEWYLQRNELAFIIAFDISASMLSLSSTATTNDVQGLTINRKDFYCGNAAQIFPIRENSVYCAIGISMLQWLTVDGLKVCYASLERVLKSNGTAVFQVYPSTLEHAECMETIAREYNFQAQLVVSFPHAAPGKKWFLWLRKSQEKAPPASIGVTRSQCIFGRRFQRSCSWYILTKYCRDCPEVRSKIERLGREHVKEAWHIWRKYRRATVIATNTKHNEVTCSTGKKMHVKAQKSLTLWPSDKLIGAALEKVFPNIELSYETLLTNMNTVVQLVHEVRYPLNRLDKL
jgi:ubiquinone/menaquinone biosynthesis C-methylase UbiE